MIRFCFALRRLLIVFKMSAVKRKLKNTKILQKCKIIKEIEKGMTNKEASEKFGVPKNTISTWMKNKEKLFKGLEYLPCEYKSQKKSWMNSEIFKEWVRKIDRKFRADDRKIALIIDNCPAHPAISNLTNMQLVFLPPNTTSILQPMDQGVIRSLKAYYRGRVVRLLCRALEKKEPCPKISILQAMKILADSWEVVTKETILFNRLPLLIQMIHLKIFKRA